MPETQIGAGKSLDDMTIGLDTLILNESKHWYRDPETKRLYAKCRVTEAPDGSFQIFLTGEAEPGHKRDSYADPVVTPVSKPIVKEDKYNQIEIF